MTVIDFSAQLPGPLATSVLADLGATVIKVEPIGGEFGRHIPGGMFDRVNRGKLSLAINLKKPESRGIVRALASRTDVAIESFRPGVAGRLGIDYETLSTINKRLIYCSLSGYGQSGPWRDKPGHDLAYLAASGAMELPGHWASPPRRSGLPVGDIVGSSTATSAILAALFERECTGTGRHIDLSLYEAAVYATATRTWFDSNERSRHFLFPTNDVFDTADGRQIAITIVEEHFWSKFVAVVAAMEPAFAEERFGTEAMRRANADTLFGMLEGLFRRYTVAEWIDAFEGTDVPIEICATPLEAGANPQLKARNLMLEPGANRKFCPFPALVDGDKRAGCTYVEPPSVGQHTRDVLGDLGYGDDAIDALRVAGVIDE